MFYVSNYRIAKLKIEIMFVPNLNIKKQFTLQIQLQNNWKQLNQLSLNESNENKKAKSIPIKFHWTIKKLCKKVNQTNYQMIIKWSTD